jgi:hypothetical protein
VTQIPPDQFGEYVEAEVQRLLAEDTAVAEQGITVTRREHTLVLTGEVETPARRDQILHLLAEHLPGVAVRAEIGIIRAEPPVGAEEIS